MWEAISMRSVHVKDSTCGMTCTFGMRSVHVGGCQYIWDEVSACGRMSVHLG